MSCILEVSNSVKTIENVDELALTKRRAEHNIQEIGLIETFIRYLSHANRGSTSNADVCYAFIHYFKY